MRRGRWAYGICGSILLLAVAGCSDDDNQPALVTAPTATPTPVSTPVPISSDLGASSNGGGCYPMPAIADSPLDMLTLINPEWSPVVNGTVVDSHPVLVHGTVLGGHGDTGGDFPSTHVRSDQNTFVRVDPADFGLIATGNDPNQGVLEIALEWEVGAYPDWAWGSPGDRIVALGRWIFDCGHPAAQPGHCSATPDQPCIVDTDCSTAKCPACVPSETCVGAHFGYSSEMHPPYATAVLRSGRGARFSSDSFALAIPATRADVFISSYAGGAGDECVLTHQRDHLRQLKVDCYPLSRPVAAKHMNDRDFEFDVPLPPKPSGAAHAVWRFDDRPTPGGVPPAVDVVPFEDAPAPYVHVRVRLTQPSAFGGTNMPTGYASTLWVGWENDPTPLTHVRVTVQGVAIRNALQRRTPVIPRVCTGNDAACRTSDDCPAGEICHGLGAVRQWRLQVAVNGEWRELSGLQSVNQGDVIPQSIVFDQYLRDGDELQIITNGIAEDCINAFFGRSLRQDLNEVGFADGVNCLGASPHNAGEVNVSRSVPAPGQTMSYEDPSIGGEGGVCSVTSDRLCVVDTDCPDNETCMQHGGSFTLRYRLERIEPCGDAAVAGRLSSCRQANSEADCVRLGGNWGPGGLRQDPFCTCPTGQAGCSCTQPSDCLGWCAAPIQGGGFDSCNDVAQGTCAGQAPSFGCFCTPVPSEPGFVALCAD